MDIKQIIVDFLKWDCEVSYGTSVGYEDGISKKVDEYLRQQLLQQTQCTTTLELLEQKLKEVTEAIVPSDDEFGLMEKETEIAYVTNVIEFIKDLQPMA